MEKEDVDALVFGRVPEGRTIDYKESLGDAGSDKGKSELLRDVSSFANTAGGTIYFGIKEERDEKNLQTGVPEAALGLADFNRDAEVGRIESVLATGIEPRVSVTPEVTEHHFLNGPVLALRIHQSWAGPHMTRDGRFYTRDNSGKKLMDYHMIRNSFISLLSLNKELRSFHQERIGAIWEGRTPLQLDQGPLLAIHAIPVSAFVPATRRLIPIADLQDRSRLVCFKDVALGRANLEGWILPHTSEAGTKEYVQMFRNGILERVHTGFTLMDRGIPVVVCSDILRIFRNGIGGFLEAQASLSIEPPIVVILAVKGVGGHRLISSDKGWGGVLRTSVLHGGFDRDELILPEMLCEDPGSSADHLIQELVDTFWQASGARESPPDIRSAL